MGWAEAAAGRLQALSKAEFAEPPRIRGLVTGFLNSQTGG